MQPKLLVMFLLLIGLTIIVPVQAITFYCSGDSAGTYQGTGKITFTSVPAGAEIAIDGSPAVKSLSPLSFKTTPDYDYQDTGMHSIALTLSGYQDFTASVGVCGAKVTYVHANLSPVTAPPTLVHRLIGINLSTVTTTPITTMTTITSVPTTTVIPTTTAVTTVTTATDAITLAAETTSIPITTESINPTVAANTAGTLAPPGSVGTLSITTTPAGALIFIDGVQRGISPATIPGLSSGSHTVVLKLEGYQDLSSPVTITAGTTQDYSTGLAKSSAVEATAAGTAATGNTTTGNSTTQPGKNPGFDAIFGIAGIGAVLVLYRNRRN